MSDILSSPCWVRATTLADPAFRHAYDAYVDERDQYGGYVMRQALRINAEDFRIAVVNPDEMPVFSPTGPSSKAAQPTSAADAPPTSPSVGFPYMAAVPFTVTPAACDDEDAHGRRCMVESAATALMDMVTSFHIIFANFPHTNGHVSLSIQTNHMRKMECGNTYLAISRIDKMGRRIVYSSVDFVEPLLQPVNDAAAAPLPMDTTAELLAAMKSATVLANVKHVKSMLSF